MHDAPSSDVDLTARFRRILLGLAAATVVGTAIELAMLRHWDGVDQLIPWVMLLVLGAAVAAQWFRPSAAVTRAARAVGFVSFACGAFGAFEHIKGNYDSAPLDFRYAPKWEAMGLLERLWTATTGGVGEVPAFAPAILALSGACLLFATVGLSTSASAAVDEAATEPVLADA